MEAADSQGFVYIAGCDDGLYKIGASRSPWVRLRQLDPSLRMVHSIQAADMFGAERTIHEVFAVRRQHGEWFALADDDLRRLRSITHLTTPESYQRLLGRGSGVTAALRRDNVQLPEVARTLGLSGRTLNEWFKPHRSRKHVNGYPIDFVCEVLRQHNVEVEPEAFRKLPIALMPARDRIIEAEDGGQDAPEDRQGRALAVLQSYQSEMRAMSDALRSLQSQLSEMEQAAQQQRQQEAESARDREEALLRELRELRAAVAPPKRSWLPWRRSQ